MMLKFFLKFLCFGPLLLNAQIQLGSIDVTVTDAGGAVIPGASVVAINHTTGASREAQTNSTGFCRLEKLQAGEWTVTVSRAGFVKSIMKSVLVQPAAETTINSKLIAGENTDTIEVTATAPLIIQQQYYSITTDLIVPGAQATSIRGAEETESATYFVRFLKRYNAYAVVRNGIIFSDEYDYRDLQPNSPSEFRENEVIGSSFEAKFSESNYTAVSSQIPSGRNILHGAISGGASNKILNARQFFDSKPNQSGDYLGTGLATIGGHFRENTFFFAGISQKTQKIGDSVLATAPTVADLTTAVENLGGTGLPTSTNSVINPGIRELLAQCEVKQNCPGGSFLWPTAAFPERRFLNSIGDLHNSISVLSGVGRLDINRPSFHISGLYSGEHNHEVAPTSPIRGDQLPQIDVKHVFSSHVGEGTLDKSITDRTIISGAASVADTSSDKLPVDPFSALLGGVPQIIVFGYSSIGPSPFEHGISRHERNYLLQTELRLLRGSHNISLGFELSRLGSQFRNDTNKRGRLLFQNLTDFFAGRPIAGSINSGGSRDLSRIYQGAHLQDNFHITQFFIINAGLRWEYRGAPESDHPFFLYNPQNGFQQFKRLYSPDLNDFAPRLGMSYNLNGWLIRSGAGLFYAGTPIAAFAGQIQNDSFHPGLAFNSPDFTSFSVLSMLPITSTSFFNSDPTQSLHADVWSIGQLRTPYSTNYAVTLRPPTGKKLSLLLGYAGSIGRKLPRITDENAPVLPTLRRPFADAANISSEQPFPPFVVNRLENTGTSSFNSLQVLTTLSESAGFSGSLQWQWSHSIDDASDVRDILPNSAMPDAGLKTTRERASSNFDVRHLLSFNASYSTRDAFRRFAMRNITISTDGSLSTGHPFNPIFGEEVDPFGLRDFAFRPDSNGLSRDVQVDPLRRIPLTGFSLPCTVLDPALLLNGCAPGTLHTGSLPRNFFTGPAIFSLSVRVSKSWKITERLTSTFGIQIANVLNTPSFPDVSTSSLTDRLDFKFANGGVSTNCNTGSPDCFLSNWNSGRARKIDISARLAF